MGEYMAKDINQKIDKYDVAFSISNGAHIVALDALWVVMYPLRRA